MWRQRKPSAVESQKNSYYTLIPYDHQRPETIDLTDRHHLLIVSIDPAQLHLALRIEGRKYGETLYPQQDGSWGYQRTFTLKSVETKVFIKKSVVPKGFRKEKGQKKKYLELDEVFANTTSYLNDYFRLLVEADLVIVEKQMSFNYRSTRVMQHIFTYFSMIFSLYPSPSGNKYRYLIQADAKAKTHLLKAPGDMSEKQVKKWSVIYGQRLLQHRQDYNAYQMLMDLGKKQDDLTDTCLQIEGLMVYLGLPIDQIDMNSYLSNVIPSVFLDNSAQLLTDNQIGLGWANEKSKKNEKGEKVEKSTNKYQINISQRLAQAGLNKTSQ